MTSAAPFPMQRFSNGASPPSTMVDDWVVTNTSFGRYRPGAILTGKALQVESTRPDLPGSVDLFFRIAKAQNQTPILMASILFRSACSRVCSLIGQFDREILR